MRPALFVYRKPATPEKDDRWTEYKFSLAAQ